MKKRKRIIILSSVLLAVVLIVILSSTLFALSSVGVEYRTTTAYLNLYSTEEIVKAGDFKIGKNIFFVDFDESIEKIEKKFPYVKVVNVERKFPDMAIVHISERVPVVRYYRSALECVVLDNELKILNVVRDENGYIEETGERLVPVFKIASDYNFELDADLELGTKLNNETLKGYVDAFYRGVYAYEKSGMSIIESIELGFESSLNCVQFLVKFRNSDLVATINSDKDLQEVVRRVVAMFSQEGNMYESIYTTTDGHITGCKK